MQEKARPHILYVEDDYTFRTHVTERLIALGVDVTTAHDDDTAIEIIDALTEKNIGLHGVITDNSFQPGQHDARGARRIITHLRQAGMDIPTFSFGTDLMRYLDPELHVDYDLMKDDFRGLEAKIGELLVSWDLID